MAAMRLSHYPIRTLTEVPGDAAVVIHQRLLRSFHSAPFLRVL